MLVSAGAICADQFLRTTNGSSLGPLGIALAYGLAFGAFVSAIGHISGGHFNPAVTIGHWVTRKARPIRYADLLWRAAWPARLPAAYLLRAVVPEDTWRAVALGTPDLANGLTRAPAC